MKSTCPCAMAIAACVAAHYMPIHAASYPLIRSGRARCVVVLPEGASAIEKHASAELRSYLHKVSGAEVAESNEPVPGLYGIFLCTRSDAPEIAALSEEGFVLQTDEAGLRIAAREPVGVLYGVYAFLEEYVGLRWFFPGSDGEYCPSLASVAVPSIQVKQNPAFTTRTLTLTCVHPAFRFDDVWDWMARNRMQIPAVKHQYAERHREEYLKRNAFFRGGGHAMSRFLPERLFDAHPEYFPLIKGQRVLQFPDPRTRNQPCTAHPVLPVRAESRIKRFFRDEPQGGVFLICNNDGQGWCECDACRAMDPAWEREKGFVSTRFYTFLNDVTRRVHDAYPAARIWGFAYQNFQHPPTAVRPDPRLAINMCLHGRCYRHSLGDESCAANGKHRDYLAGWSGLANQVMAREYYSCFVDQRGLPDAIVYLPLEKLVADDIRYLHRIGVRGWQDEVPPMNAPFSQRFAKRSITESWRARFPLYYVAAKLTWDPDQDLDALLADMNEKLYGPAASAMEKYRDLLTECWHKTNGHFIYGGAYVAMGRSLARPGAQEKLLAYLAEAEAAAAGDAPVRARVQLDREYFELAWQRTYRQFQAMARGDVHAQKREGKVRIDGALDEPAWKRAEYVTGFMRNGTQRAEHQTYVRLLYDTDSLYVAVEAEEPHTDQLRADHQTRDSKVWSDDAIEIFIDPQGTGERYYHFAVNPSGALYDAECDVSAPFNARFNADCETAASALDDRWIVELRLRASSMAATIRDMGQWKVNIGRSRKAAGAREHSTWFDGAYHQPASFRTVVFGRQAVIQNGGFEDLVELDTDILLKRHGRGWTFTDSPPRLPRSWSLHEQHKGTAAAAADARSGDWAWQVTNGWFHQRLNIRLSRSRPLRIEFWTKGNGKIRVAAYLYTDADGRARFERTEIIGSARAGPDWRRHELTYPAPTPKAPLASLAFWVDGTAALDDVIVRREEPRN